MTPRNWWAGSSEQPGAPGVRALSVSSDDWSQAARELAARGARLLALWASHSGHEPPKVHAAFLIDSGALLLSLMTEAEARWQRAIERIGQPASQIKRTIGGG